MKIALGRDYTTIVRNKNYRPKCMNESSVQSDKVNKIITIWNKYFNYSLLQAYHVEKDLTEFKFTLNFKMSKWLHTKLILVSRKYAIQAGYDYDHILFYEYDKNYLLTISVYNPYEYSVHMSTKKEGLSFLTTYQMIEQKDRIMKPYKRFLSSFKEMDSHQIKTITGQVSVEESKRLIREHLDIPLTDAILININNLV